MGARIGYFQGDVKKLVEDIATLRPTLFIGTHPCHYRPCCKMECLWWNACPALRQGNSSVTGGELCERLICRVNGPCFLLPHSLEIHVFL